MNLLALDTSTRSCSVAVVIGDRLAAEVSTVTPRTHSAHLMHMIGEALALAHLKPAEVDGFAVTVGPGSFTGLRIGLSTVKGLAFASGKPCIGVSGLEALAAAVRLTRTRFAASWTPAKAKCTPPSSADPATG